MNLFKFLGRRATAPVARERLQILLAHERKSGCDSDLITILHKEVLNAVSKHIAIDPDRVDVSMHRRDMISVLEIDITIEPGAAHENSVNASLLLDGSDSGARSRPLGA
jgi:cell division topological specificity factor